MAENGGDAEAASSSSSLPTPVVVHDTRGKTAFFQNLALGFIAIKQRRDQGLSGGVVPIDKPDFRSHVLVNFIDPSSSPSVISPSKPTPQRPPVQLYEKLQAVFVNDCHSKLYQVPYQSPRTGAMSVIDSLKVKTLLTKSHGGLVTTAMDVDGTLPWGGQAGLSASGGDDPSEWHATPYCHVYMAACESLEHYKNRVKPSIQVFLSQIEAPVSSPPAATVAATTCSQYVLVYVPTGCKVCSPAADGSNADGLGARARMSKFVSRVAEARQKSLASDGTGDLDDNAANASAVGLANSLELSGGSTTTLTAHLSKVEKDLARRMALDFPAGNVCIMSSLMMSPDDGADEYSLEVQKTEWANFLRALGISIADGFKERCQRYGDELRQQDRLRSLASEGTHMSRAELARNRKRFDLSYYLLIKESLAFTYEQMCLPSEALLQYDEMRAVLPELNAQDKKTKYLVDETLSRIAMTGDTNAFRRRLGTFENSIAPIAPIIHQYLFSRSTTLLFEMDKSVDVIGRCIVFIKSMYDFQLHQLPDDVDDADDDVKAKRKAVEAGAFDFCWDIKRACDYYLAEDVSESANPAIAMEDSGQGKGDHNRRKTPRVDEALAKSVCDLVDFARMRLLKLGDWALGNTNPVRALAPTVAQEHEKPWDHWKPNTTQQEESHTEEEVEDGEVANFIENALSSPGSFIASYLGLLKVLEAYNRFSGRKRCAARLCVDMAGLHILRGDNQKAATALRVAAKAYSEDKWEACHFMLLFRLAVYQRQVSTADDYIATLVQCFGPGRELAPAKALDCLLSDLETVLRSSWVSRKRLGSMPIFDPVMGLDGFKPSPRSGSVRDLFKKVYTVAEKASVSVTLESFLPKALEAEAVSVELAPFEVYVRAMEENTNVKENEFSSILRFKGPATISPGLNEFLIDWVPMVPGQFILARTTVTWNSTHFIYTAVDLKRPVMRIDVIPSEPTQSIELVPAYLLPGHKQPMTLSFRAGTDIVRAGSVKCVCSPGLHLVLPGGEESETTTFSSSLETPLPDCAPGETVDIPLLVKSSEVEHSPSDHGSHSLHATVTTSFRPPFPEGADIPSEDEENAKERMMNHVMEAAVSTLSSQALTIKYMELFPYSLDRTVLNISLKCNIPSGSFLIRRWEISLPAFLTLTENGDLNDCLKDSHVKAGELISLSFDCLFSAESTSSQGSSQLLIEIQDEFGHSFEEILKLGLRRPASADRASLPRTKKAVSIAVQPSSIEGFAGQPIHLTYKVDTSELTGLTESIRYKLDWDNADWLVSGQAEGLVPKEAAKCSFDLPFVAIPVRPGIIKDFPSFSLHYCQTNGKETLLTALEAVDVTKPDSFLSKVSPQHTAIACPVSSSRQPTLLRRDSTKSSGPIESRPSALRRFSTS